MALYEQKVTNLVILKSTDGQQWEAMPPNEVPEWVKADDIIKSLNDGLTVQWPGTNVWYVGMPAESVSKEFHIVN